MTTIGPKHVIEMLQRYSKRKEYAALKKSCRANVVEWRWATFPMLPKLPHDETVSGLEAPEWLEKRPEYGSLHGLDAAGRIVAIRTDDLKTPDNKVHEQFLIHEADGFWCLFFGDYADKPVNAIEWYEARDGRLQRSLTVNHYGLSERVLRWEADRLIEHIDRCWEEVSTDDPEGAAKAKFSKEGSSHTINTYTYAPDGSLQRVADAAYFGLETKPAFEEVKYNRVPKGVSLAKLLAEVEELLVVEIPKALRAAKIKETVYCLLVQLSGVDSDPCGFPPPLILAPQTTRERLLKEQGKNVTYYAWAIDELRNIPGTIELDCKHKNLEENLNLIFQLTIKNVKKNNYGPVRKMFQRVCARLNDISWQRILKTTDDFIVFPSDNRGDMDPRQDIKASVPAEKLKVLMERGYMERMKLK